MSEVLAMPQIIIGRNPICFPNHGLEEFSTAFLTFDGLWVQAQASAHEQSRKSSRRRRYPTNEESWWKDADRWLSHGERQIRCRVIIEVKTGQEHMYHKSPGRRQLVVFIQNGCSFVVPDYPWSLAYWFNRVTARMRFDKSLPRCNHFTGCMGISKSCCPGL